MQDQDPAPVLMPRIASTITAIALAATLLIPFTVLVKAQTGAADPGSRAALLMPR